MTELTSVLLGVVLTLALVLDHWTLFLILGTITTLWLLAHAPKQMWNNEKSTGTGDTDANK